MSKGQLYILLQENNTGANQKWTIFRPINQNNNSKKRKKRKRNSTNIATFGQQEPICQSSIVSGHAPPFNANVKMSECLVNKQIRVCLFLQWTLNKNDVPLLFPYGNHTVSVVVVMVLVAVVVAIIIIIKMANIYLLVSQSNNRSIENKTKASRESTLQFVVRLWTYQSYDGWNRNGMAHLFCVRCVCLSCGITHVSFIVLSDTPANQQTATKR